MVTGNTVYINDGNVEKALRKFKKKVAESQILQELRAREHYTKPTTARKIKKAQARSRWLKHVRSQQLPDTKF